MTVKKAILKSATQTASKKIEAVIVGDTKDLKTADFKVTNTATNATVAVKSVTAKKNVADTFVIETFTDMKDAREYTVAYDGTTVKFTATDGVVAKVGISTTEIAAASATEIKATTIDKNGVVLDETGIDATDSSKGKVTSEVKFTKGYQDGAKLYLPAVGDTATIKVTYHTGTFGTDGKETGNIEDTFTVTAVDPSLINLTYAVTIDTKAPAWTAESFKANNQVKIGAPRKAYFRITKDDGNDIDNYGDYTVETADKTKLLVESRAISSNSTDIAVNGVAEGTTYILVKKDDKTVASLPITVVAKPVASSLALDKTSVTVAKTVSSLSETVKATIKDQYNDDMTTDSVEITVLGKPSANAEINGTNYAVNKKLAASDFTISRDNRSISVSGDKFDTKGTYTFKISAKNGDKTLDRTFTVNVVDKVAVQSYEVKVDNAEVDTTIDKDGNLPSAITVTTSQMANGAAIAPVTASAITYVVKKGSDTIYETNGKTSAAIHNGLKQTEDGDLVITPVLPKDANNHFDKVLSAGTYNVTATFTVDSKTVTVGSSFVIKDTQDSKVSYKIEKNDLDGQTVASAFANSTYVKVYYDGQEQTVLAADIDSVDGTIITGKNSAGAFVKTVKLYVTVSGSNGSVKVPVTLTVNDQFSNCGGLK